MLDVTERILAMRQYVDSEIAAAIEILIIEASDARLNRVNPLAFAREHGFSDRDSIAAFLHATKLGLFELSWNVTCASCGGILHSAGSLRTLDQHVYHCAFCAMDCEPNLNEIVEVTFTVDPRIRRIAAHDPETLRLWDYLRQIYWSSGSDLPDDLASVAKEAVLDALELPPGGYAFRDIQVDKGSAILFDPVTHSAQFFEDTGADSGGFQATTVVIDDARSTTATRSLAPGPLRLTLENKTSRRVFPILWIVGTALASLVKPRKPVLTAAHLLTHQTFRDLYRTDVLDMNQRFTITNLTFLFTDLKSSTELYELMGDLAAFDLIRSHFQIAHEIIAKQGGAIVKTIGDAIMATFPYPIQSIAAAFEIKDALRQLKGHGNERPLLLKIGVHTGPCLAVLMNERQDFFGQTVNIASRLQDIAASNLIRVTSVIANDGEVRDLLARRGFVVESAITSLRGINQEMLIYGIPY